MFIYIFKLLVYIYATFIYIFTLVYLFTLFIYLFTLRFARLHFRSRLFTFPFDFIYIFRLCAKYIERKTTPSCTPSCTKNYKAFWDNELNAGQPSSLAIIAQLSTELQKSHGESFQTRNPSPLSNGPSTSANPRFPQPRFAQLRYLW